MKNVSSIMILLSLLTVTNRSYCSQQITTFDAFFLGFIAGVGTAFYLTNTITNTIKAADKAAIAKKEAEMKTALARKEAADSIMASNQKTERVRLEEMAKLAQEIKKNRQEIEIELRKQRRYKQAQEEAKRGNLERAQLLLQTDRPLSPQISLV